LSTTVAPALADHGAVDASPNFAKHAAARNDSECAIADAVKLVMRVSVFDRGLG